MRILPKLITLYVAIFVIFHATRTFAWGIEGHQVIAKIAQSSLTPKASTEINKLLELEPNASLVSISTWADEHKSRSTASWHYINFPRNSCSYIPERDCNKGDCLIATLEKQIKILRSNESDEKKMHTLKYVVHLMGDIHQPMHAGFADDKGGNTYQIQAFRKGTNLHSLWDSGLINQLKESTDVLSNRLLSQGKKLEAPLELNPIHMALESCKIVQAKNFYPSRKVEQAYIDHSTPILEGQLLLGGKHLAQLLNDIYK